MIVLEEFMLYGFMQRALMAAVMAGLLCSILSFFVVSNRLSFMGAGVSHSMLGGLAMGALAGVNPLYTGGVFAVVVSLLVGYITKQGKMQADTVTGVFFAGGMALGVTLISLKEGYYPELFSLLFGNVLTVSYNDLYFLGGVMTGVLLFIVFFFKELLAVSFDEELARANGLPVKQIYLGLMVALALSVLASVMVVGVVLSSALLVIPAAAGYRFSQNYKGMLAISVVVGLFSGVSGLLFTLYCDIPSGAAIVLCATVIFFISLFYKQVKNYVFRRFASG